MARMLGRTQCGIARPGAMRWRRSAAWCCRSGRVLELPECAVSSRCLRQKSRESSLSSGICDAEALAGQRCWQASGVGRPAVLAGQRCWQASGVGPPAVLALRRLGLPVHLLPLVRTRGPFGSPTITVSTMLRNRPCSTTPTVLMRSSASSNGCSIFSRCRSTT